MELRKTLTKARASPGDMSPEDLALINKQSQRELLPEEIFAFKLHACDNDVDRDLETIAENGLHELSALYMGKTIISDHLPKASNQFARIYKTDVESTTEYTQNGELLARLVAFCYALRTETNKDFIAEIEAGIKREVSIGCRCDSTVCSICGVNRRTDFCEHIKGREYAGRKCFWRLSDFTDAYEISFVAIPAQRKAGVIKSYIPHYKKGDKIMTKDFLQAKIKSATDAIASIEGQMETAEDVAVCKNLSAQMRQLEADREAFKAVLLEMEKQPPSSAEKGFVPMGTYTAIGEQKKTETEDDDFTNSMEYRKAFRDLVQKGTPISAETFKASASTLTTDIGSAIPTVLVNRIVEKMETVGMILPMATKTAFAAGIEIPTSTIKPVATWVAEGKGSDRQKKTTGKIIFTHHKLRCEISMSMETYAMALSSFEAAFVRQVSEAMVKAQEIAMLSGSGSGQPKGILKETPASGQALTAKVLDYTLLVNAEAALPQAYEGGAVWCMTKKTFMGFVGILDTNKQPIARVNYGLSGKPERSLLGRTVVLCGDYMDSFAAGLPVGTIFAFIFNFSDYAMNTIYNMGIQRKQDWDTEDMLTKAVLSCDGKVIDVNSLVTIAMGA